MDMSGRRQTRGANNWNLLLGKTIARARQQVGLTQKELCRRTGLSYSTLTKIERGVIQTPSVFTIAKIARATNTSVEDLLAQVDPASSSPTGVEMVYFDVDGSLIDGLEGLWLEVAVGNDQPVSRVRHHFWRHWPAGSRFRRQPADAAANQNSLAWVDSYVQSSRPVRPLIDLMARLSRKMKIGLLSHNSRQLVDKLLEAKKLPDLDYQAVASFDQLEADAPADSIYDHGRQLAGLEAPQILLVDRSPINLARAETAGWRTHRSLSHRPSWSAGQIASYLRV